MAKMDELFNDMYHFCEENDCWGAWMTAKEWSECIGTKYSSTSFTALVRDERLVREENYKGTAYEYRIVPTEKIKEKIEEAKEKRERKTAEYIIAHYEEHLAKRKAEYEERIKQVEEQYQHDLEWEAKMLADAKKVLEDTCE